MPAPDRPCAQSWHTALLKSNVTLTASEPWRHVPGFLKSHHAGIVADVESRSRTNSLPETCARSAGSSNEQTSVLLAPLVLQANALLPTRPSPAQTFQLRLIPGAARAEDATRSMAAAML